MNPIQSNSLKSPFLKELIERGFLYQCTNLEGLDQILSKTKISAYLGFDCTATSLHVGSLMQIMLLRLLEKHGHTPIVLLGGATTRIGDPSDKQEMRKMLSLEDIEKNKNSISKIFYKTLDRDKFKIADNADWLTGLKYLDFLRDYGCHFSINRMLSFDSVKLRLEREQPLTFLEFNYMLLQAYDFVELNRRHNCRLQFGGSEQWGNIVSGIDLSRRIKAITNEDKDGSEELFGITTPLITTAGGAKMGKTAKGAVWLNDDMLSPYDFWQFWRNVDDADVGRFLRIYSELPISEIESLEKLHGKDINEAKIVLANTITSICHGKDAATQAFETATLTFTMGEIGTDIPIYELHKKDYPTGVLLYHLLVMTKLSQSNTASRNLIKGKGVRIDDIMHDDEKYTIQFEKFNHKNEFKLSVGKKEHLLVKIIH